MLSAEVGDPDHQDGDGQQSPRHLGNGCGIRDQLWFAGPLKRWRNKKTFSVTRVANRENGVGGSGNSNRNPQHDERPSQALDFVPPRFPGAPAGAWARLRISLSESHHVIKPRWVVDYSQAQPNKESHLLGFDQDSERIRVRDSRIQIPFSNGDVILTTK